MGGNIYGVANPILVPTALAVVGGADVSCPSGTKTTVIASGTLISQSPGSFFPIVWGTLFVVLGGTPPSALAVGAQLGSGASVDTMTVEPGLLTASAELIIPVALVGSRSATAWYPTGSVVNVTVTPTGQTVTAKLDSRAIVLLNRGPDS